MNSNDTALKTAFLCRKLCRKLRRVVGQPRDGMLTHHRLKVYEKAVALGNCAQEFSAGWGRRHAIVEHFRRASESSVVNIAEGARLVSGRLYQQKALPARVETARGRELLSRIVAMLSRF